VKLAVVTQRMVGADVPHVNHDFADTTSRRMPMWGSVDVSWIDEDDAHVNPLGANGLAKSPSLGPRQPLSMPVYDGAGLRIRELPIRLDKVLA
jgi:xanthine dehydrogenase YagR molybdenum-binding subunit